MATVERLGCWWTTSNFAITFFLLRYLRKIGKNMSFLCANVKTRKPTSLSWNLWQDSWRNHFLWRLKGLKLRRREGSILCFRDIRLAHYNRLHNHHSGKCLGNYYLFQKRLLLQKICYPHKVRRFHIFLVLIHLCWLPCRF